MTSAEILEARLSKHLKMRLEVMLNENRTTMLSVLERRRHFARVSIHKMFLQAPDEVLSAVAAFVQGRPRRGDLRIRGYIQTQLKELDYSHLVESKRLVTNGRFYDLQKIFEELREEYFDGTFEGKITWYGKGGRKNRTRVIFGQYIDQLKLIKINRILDDPFFPDYFVRYIVYHEMVHGAVPGFVDGRGYFRTHGTDFKEREKQFCDYERAIEWEKRNKKHFFRR